MNEYQDQTLWWEVQFKIGNMWVYVSDHDTREDAEDWQEQYEEEYKFNEYRTVRKCGLPA